eukprot:SAG31_NODE_5989_length_2224_cov_1.316706_1_plen_383_part_00
MKIGRAALEDDSTADNAADTRARRILFVTDMLEMRADDLSGQIAGYAEESVFVSIVGMGVEFNAGLTSVVAKNKGSIYSSATSEDELRSIIVDDFAYNTFPVAYDVNLSIRSGDVCVEETFGTPWDAETCVDKQLRWDEDHHSLHPPGSRTAAGRLMLSSAAAGAALPVECIAKVISDLEEAQQTLTEINTFFPGHINEADGCSIKGGLVLVKLGPQLHDNPDTGTRQLELTLKYTNLVGKQCVQTQRVALNQEDHADFRTDVGLQCSTMSELDVEANRVCRSLCKAALLQKYVCRCQAAMDVINNSGISAEPLQTVAQQSQQQTESIAEAAVDQLQQELTAVHDSIVTRFEHDSQMISVAESIVHFREQFGKAMASGVPPK